MKALHPRVEVEEVITRYEPADNGAGPLWCYGAPLIARSGGDVYASIIETGKGIPPLCNTRWQLWHRTPGGWRVVQHEEEFREREPCPLGLIPQGPLFLSINPRIQEPVGRPLNCRPLVLEWDPAHLDSPPRRTEPVWTPGARYTEHSYRGFAVDGRNATLLLLNIDAASGAQFISYRGPDRVWQAKGRIEFPIRSCYPQVALRDRAAHVLAIGDIVEPVEEWRRIKKEVLKRDWDYVFRRLFYAYTPDIETKPFAAPVEIDNVDQTAGHITNLDLYVDAAGAAHVLYLRQPFQHDFLRQKFFPDQPMSVQLEYVILRNGQVIRRQTLARTPADRNVLAPAYGRFHESADGTLWVVVAGTTPGPDGAASFGDFVARLPRSRENPEFTRIDLRHPFRTFFTNTPRGGSVPSDRIDLFGVADDAPNLRYARVRLTPAE